MIDPLAMPVFKPLWEAFPYLPGCFAAWRGMSLGEISASAYATADGERRPSDAIVDCMAKHAARSLGNDVGEAVKRYFSRNSAVLSANLHGIDCLPEMVQAVSFFGLNRLAGVRGCWSPCVASGGELPRTAGNGTAFFWGVDGRGRRHPLRLSPDNGAFEFPGFHLPLVPEAVIGALRDRNIYPGLFVSYMTLALEHGLCCHGGIFLVRYLPTMLHAVRDLFMECGEPLPPLPGRTMLAAFAISMQARETGRLFPAGMLELLTSGGISRADLQRLADLPLAADPGLGSRLAQCGVGRPHH